MSLTTLPLYAPELFASCDDLLERRRELDATQYIPDMYAFCFAWQTLADDFDACGLTQNAEYCRGKYRQYSQVPNGEYVRLIEPPVAELLQVS